MSDPPSSLPSPSMRSNLLWLAVFFAVVFGLMAFISLSLSLVPYDWLRARLDVYSGDGSADAYTPLIHQRLTYALYGVSALSFLIAAAAIAFRSVVVDFLRRLELECAANLRRCQRWLAQVTWLNWLALTMATAILVVVPLHFIDEPIRYDEAHTYVNYATEPLFVTVTKYDAANNHVLHSIASNVSLRLFGDSLIALRLPAWIATIAASWLVWAIAIRFSRTHLSGFAAVLFASLPTVFESATNARGHMLGTCFLLAGLYAVELLVSKPFDTWRSLLLMVTVAAALYSVPTTVYGVLLLSAWIVVRPLETDRSLRWRWQNLICAALGVASASVLYAPILLTNSVAQLREAIGSGNLSFVQTFLLMPSYLLSTWSWLFWDVPIIVQLTLVSVPLLCVLFARIESVLGWRALVVLSMVVPVLLLQRTLPPSRIWIIVLPVLIIMFSRALEQLYSLKDSTASALFYALTIVVLGSINIVTAYLGDSLHVTQRHGVFRPAAQVAQWLKEHAVDRQPIAVVTPTSATIAYHFKRNGWSMDHFLVPGHGLTDDRSLLVVIVPGQTNDVHSVVDELNMQTLFDTKRASLTEILQFDQSNPVEIWSVPARVGSTP